MENLDLETCLKDAIDGCNPSSGDWSYEASACSVIVGVITLKDGREAQVTIKVETDKDEWQ